MDRSVDFDESVLVEMEKRPTFAWITLQPSKDMAGFQRDLAIALVLNPVEAFLSKEYTHKTLWRKEGKASYFRTSRQVLDFSSSFF